MFKNLPVPDDTAAVSAVLAFGSGDADGQRYYTGLLTGTYRLGAGHFVLNTLRILENLGANPAADRLLLNMVRYVDGLARAPEPSQPGTATPAAQPAPKVTDR